jgi:diketogulonate reductase-like aldo/keto reductase
MNIGIGSKLNYEKGENIESYSKNISTGLELGYRFIDLWNRDESTGPLIESIKDSEIHRSEIFICAGTYSALSESDFKNKYSNLEYLDLLYICNPPITTDISVFRICILELYNSLYKLKNAGLIKNIGICNFYDSQLELFLKVLDEYNLEYPEYGLLEIHPLNSNFRLVQKYKNYNIRLISFSPLGYEANGIYKYNKQIKYLSKKYNCTVYNILLAYCTNNDIIPIPKAYNLKHLESNLTSIQLESSDLDLLESLNINSIFNNDSVNAKMTSLQLRY